MGEETYFGFEKINKNIKKDLVAQVFSNVSAKYDLMNNLMSFGIHKIWKNFMISKIRNTQGSLLDVAGGTGDIAELYYNKAKRKNHSPNINLCDINIDMLNIAKEKLIDKNILNFDYICGNAEDLPVKSDIYDYYTIAFGIRNVTDIQKALSEAYRVLKSGGKFLCLEFSQVNNDLISKLYDFYSFNIIPTIGKIVVDDKKSYQYLVESIRKFPNQEEFLSMLKNAGFRRTNYINMSFGITALWYGYKI